VSAYIISRVLVEQLNLIRAYNAEESSGINKYSPKSLDSIQYFKYYIQYVNAQLHFARNVKCKSVQERDTSAIELCVCRPILAI